MLLPVRRRRLALLGPAFVAAVAYVDPGNVATNVTAGSEFGYRLVWVVVIANAMAVIVQYLSAKLGIVSGKSLATHLGERLPPTARICFWLQAEAIAIATDMAEVVGGAIALALLFDLPLPLGALVTAMVSLGILWVGDTRGQSALERVIMAFLALIAVGFMAGLLVDPPDAGGVGHGLLPSFDGSRSVLVGSGIIGATVMPHVIYLHSSLTTSRLGRRSAGLSLSALLAVTRVDVGVALALAGILNLALLVVAATSLHGLPGTDSLHGVYHLLDSQLGAGVAILFAVALLSSGLASTSVGNAAGAEVMRGLLQRDVALAVRRVVSVVPALVVLLLGADPSSTLVISQVVLSIGIPFALVPLIILTSRRDVMGAHVNRWGTTVAASGVATVVIVLNLTLLALTIGG